MNKTSNPYMATLGVISLLGIALGLIVMITGGTAAILGVALFTLGALCLAGALTAGAINWEKPGP